MTSGLRLTQQQFDALQKRTRGGDSTDSTAKSLLATRRSSSKSGEHVAAGAASAKTRSYLEEMLAQHIAWAGGFYPYEREFLFAPPRKWRIDFAWISPRLAVEVQGEVHRIKSRFDADIEKIQALVLAGWRYLPLSSKDIRTGKAIELIERALKL